jgi:hypothetical protein
MHNWRRLRYGDPLFKKPGTRGPNIPPQARIAIQSWVRAVVALGDAKAIAGRLGLEVHTVEVAAIRYRMRLKARSIG